MLTVNYAHVYLTGLSPSFLGEDYTSVMLAMKSSWMMKLASRLTLLWDGADCLCCNNPPWFYKQLPQPTTDDIEMRVCKDGSDENIAITEIEIYVQY